MRVLARVLPAIWAVGHGALALHAEDAGKVDWHKQQIGIPLSGPRFAPNFHRVPPYRHGQTWKSVILTATEANVLAGINPADGALVWRRQFSADDVIVNMKTNDDVLALYGRGEPKPEADLDPRGPVVVAALSGPGGANLRVFEATNGLLTFETQLHKPQDAILTEPVTLSNDIQFALDSESPDIFVLTNGRSVTRVNGYSGLKKWRWESQDQSSAVIYTKVVVSSTAVYAVGLVKSIRSYTLHVVALDTQTGTELASVDVPSDITDAQDSLVAVSAKTVENPFIIWSEGGKTAYFELNRELSGKPTTVAGAKYDRVLDVNLELSGIVVGIRPDGSAQIIRLDVPSRKVVTAWEFPVSVTVPSEYSESTFSGTLDRQGKPYVARTFWAHQPAVGATHVLTAHGDKDGGHIHGTGFKFDTIAHGIIVRGAIDAANPQPGVVVSRTLVVASTGSLQLWQQEKMVWNREEALGNLAAVEFVDLPERKAVVGGAAAGSEGFLPRLFRHIGNLQNLPNYAFEWSQRFLSNSYTLNAAKPGDLWRDPFGFRKVIIAASRSGKVFVLDSTTGAVIWTKLFGMDARGGTIEPVRIFVLRTAVETSEPEVVILAHHHMPGETSETVAYHFYALTGEQVYTKGFTALSGVLLFKTPIRDAYLLQSSTPRVIVLVDDTLKVHMYPLNEPAATVYNKVGNAIRFALPSTSLASHQLIGYSTPLSPKYPFLALEQWRTAFPAGEEIISVVRRSHEPSVSIGRVLADKTTLYRYLNPNLLAVVTASRAGSGAEPSCAVSVLDGAKGTIVYRAELHARGTPCDVHVAFAQNWLTYHYYDPRDGGQDSVKGYRLVTVELFEGLGPDDKTSSSDASADSIDLTRVHAVENSFIALAGVAAMATTTTKHGITTRNLIVANSKDQIVSLPRRLLDPRRHRGKPSAADQEEGLVPYEPIIPDDPRMVISHGYPVFGVRHIVTSPAQLESTSLVLAYGLDLFGTRVTPSGTFDLLSESFNKVQLALTVCGLLIAIIIVKPIARNKILRQKWYG